jgi:hypothetical protein
MISAAHPYAPLVVSYLAEASKIIAPRPRLYFVPDDENFGEIQKDFCQHSMLFGTNESLRRIF